MKSVKINDLWIKFSRRASYNLDDVMEVDLNQLYLNRDSSNLSFSTCD